MPSRNLVVVRDALGYGLTLSGDQPVFVQTVRAGGAAERAGIAENDVIVRVNGKKVTEDSHTSVVNMIQGRNGNITLSLLNCLSRCHSILILVFCFTRQKRKG